MATLIKVWNPTSIASVHPQAGTIKPGLNIVEVSIGERLIYDGIAVKYDNQDGQDESVKKDIHEEDKIVSDKDEDSLIFKPKFKKKRKSIMDAK